MTTKKTGYVRETAIEQFKSHCYQCDVCRKAVGVSIVENTPNDVLRKTFCQVGKLLGDNARIERRLDQLGSERRS